MGMCLNKRVLVGLGAVGLGVLVFAPQLLGAVGPLLLLAACPLSMVFMMRAMNSGGQSANSCGSNAQDQDAQLRELQEEVNRLKAEAQLRGQSRPG